MNSFLLRSNKRKPILSLTSQEHQKLHRDKTVRDKNAHHSNAGFDAPHISIRGKSLLYLLLLFVWFTPVTGFGQAKPAAGAANPETAPEGHISHADKSWKKGGRYGQFKPEQEVLVKRDEFSKHFQLGNGKATAVISKASVHYRKDKSSPWEDIRTDIRPNETGLNSSYDFAIPENTHQLYFSKNFGHGTIFHVPSGDIQIGTGNKIWLVSSTGEISNETAAKGSATGSIQDEDKLTYSGTYPFASDQLAVRSTGIDHDIILSQKPDFINGQNSSSLVCREYIKLPQGWKVVPRKEASCASCGQVVEQKGLAVLDASGNLVLEIPVPLIKEQNMRINAQGGHTEQVEGTFKVETAEAGVYVDTYVPVAWLNDAERQYPVIIDPAYNAPQGPAAASTGSGISSSASAGYCGYYYCGDFWGFEPGGYPEGWCYFVTSSISTSATIDNVNLAFYNDGFSAPCSMKLNGCAAPYSSSSQEWSYETAGTNYYSGVVLQNGGYNFYGLNSSASSDLQARLASGYFGVAYEPTAGYVVPLGWYYGSGDAPYLIVTYDQCFNTTNGYGTFQTSFTPSCSSQALNMPSTSYCSWSATGGVTYNFSLSGSGWSGNDMTVYYNNGSSWTPLANAANSLSVTPSSSQTLYISAYNGTGCPTVWNANSATLTYQIAPASTPAISESPNTQVCTGSNVVYTATGISVGAFDYFQYEWNGSGGYSGPWIGSNPGTWTSGGAGNTLYVEAVSSNGGCLAYSSPVTVAIDAPSSTGSFVSTLYACGNGSIYTAAGVETAQSITGYTGSILGWGYGTSGTCSANNAAYPANAGNPTSPWNCCFDIGSDATTVMVEVQNGACPVAQSCYTMTPNTLTAPTSASISPTNLVCSGTGGNITLSYTGGGSNYLPATLKWYSGSCGGTYLGTGNNLVVAAPSSTTTYYCAWVDPCSSLSGCASATYTVASLPTVSAASYSICMGSTTTLSPSTGGTWVSNNTSVATVSGNTVTPVGPGTATFTFTSSSAPYCLNTTAAVSVTSVPVVSITGPTSFCGTTTTTLSPVSGGTWASNNTAVATVSGYTVTGTSAGGSTNFTFTSSTAPNCSNTTANITVTGQPIIYGVTGGGTYCLGSSAPVGLSNSQTGVNYQLILNGSTNMGSPVAGTGSAISFPNQTALGTYTVIATTVTNSCSISMSGNAVVTTLSPNVTNSPGGTGASPNGGTLNGTD